MNNTLKIYIVDDDPDYSKVMKGHLSAKGYEVSTFLDGFSFLDAIEVNPPDVVISDLMMPVMSGHSLGYQLKNRYPEIHTIISSSMEEVKAPEKEAYWNENTPFFQKPVDLHKLYEHLESLKK
jgi:DNA-binding NtrC family response regulator